MIQKSPKIMIRGAIGLSIILFFSLFLTKSYAKHISKTIHKTDPNTIIHTSSPNSAAKTNENIITDLINDSNLYGTMAVVRNGKLLYTEGFGYGDYEKQLKNDDNLLYPIASLQKRMTAVIIAQLIREGKLGYSTTIDSFYPEIESSDSITIRDLLNHTSGLMMPETAPANVLGTEEEQLNNVFETSYELGNRDYAYSNGNYSLLAGIISQIEGTTYAKSLNKRIIEPLNMENTFLWNDIPESKQTPTEYFSIDGTDYDQSHSMYSEALMSSLLGAGNIYASASDIATFELALGTDTVLTADEYYTLFETKKNDIVQRVGNISSDGQKGGYSSYIYGDVGNQNMVIFLVNQSSNESTEDLLSSIYQQLLLF